jgi:hypothetical protein
MSEYQRNWVINNPHKVRAKARRRRQAVKQAGGEKVDLKELVERAGGRCCLCGLPVLFSVKPGTRLYGTREHYDPVTRGGVTSYATCDLAHHGCNCSKGNRTLEEFRAREAALPVHRRRPALVARQLAALGLL